MENKTHNEIGSWLCALKIYDTWYSGGSCLGWHPLDVNGCSTLMFQCLDPSFLFELTLQAPQYGSSGLKVYFVKVYPIYRKQWAIFSFVK